MEKEYLIQTSESREAERRMKKNEVLRLTKKLYSLTVLFPKKEPLRYKMREVAIDVLANPKPEDLEVLDSFFEVAKAQRWIKQNDMVAIQEGYAKLKGELTEPKADERQLSLKGDLFKKPENLQQDLQGEKTVLGEKDLYFHLHLPSPVASEIQMEEKKESSICTDLQELSKETDLAEIKLPETDTDPQKEKKDLKMGSMQERQEKIMDFLRESGRAQVWQTKQILPEVTKRTLRRDFEHMLKKGLIERVGERNDTYYQVKVR